MQFAAVWLLAAAASFTAFEQSEAYDIGENQINAGANALNAATQNAIGSAGVGSGLTNNIGGSQVINSGSIIQGSGNTVNSLLNVDPQINAVVNALNSLNQESAAASDGASGNTIGGRQIQQADTQIVGQGNTVSSLANVNPQVNAGVGLLSSVTQTVSGATGGAAGGQSGSDYNENPQASAGTPTARGSSSSASGNSIGGQQRQNTGANIVGDGNTVSSLANVSPQVNAGVNLLSSVTQTLSGATGGSGGLLGGVLSDVGGAANNIGGRQTMATGSNIQGNRNQVFSLLNVDPQINADVNALNTVNQSTPGGASGAGTAGNNIGGSQAQSTGNGIVGDGNTVSSLVNVNPQVNAGVNLLSSAAQTVSSVAGGVAGASGGLLGDVLGSATSGLLGGVLGGATSGVLGGVLGGATNGLLGDVVGGFGGAANDIGGQQVVNALNIVNQNTPGEANGAGSRGAVNNLGGSQAQSSGNRIVGDGNTVSSLANVNPQVNAGVNLLSSVTQTLSDVIGGGASGGLLGGALGAVEGSANNIGGRQLMDTGSNIQGNNNQVSNLINVDPQVNADVNALSSVNQRTAGGIGGAGATGAGNSFGGGQAQNTGNRIVGDGNTVSSLANVNPQVNAGLNLLSSVTQTLSGAAGGSDGPLGGVLSGVGGAANNIGGRQTMATGSNIQGNRNQVFSLLNVDPQINADVDALNIVNQSTPGGASGAGTAGSRDAGNNIGGSQAQSSGNRIVGDGNTVSSLANVNPQVDAVVNLLSSVTQTVSGATGGGASGGLLGGALGLANSIGGRQQMETGSNIQGNNNQVSNLINVDPQVNADVNALSSVNQRTAAGSGGAEATGAGGAGNSFGGGQAQIAGNRIVGDGNTVSSLANVNPQVNAGVNLLSSVTQTLSGAAGGSDGPLGGVLSGVGGAANNIGGRQTMATGSNIQGNRNQVFSLLNVNPQINADVNALNTVNQSTPGGASGAETAGSRDAGNNIGGSQAQSAGNRIVGDGNTVSSLANVNPQVNAGVNLLSSATETVSGVAGGAVGASGGLLGGVLGSATWRGVLGGATSGVLDGVLGGATNRILGGVRGDAIGGPLGGVVGGLGGAENNIGGQQVLNRGSTILGNNNQVSSLLNVDPQVNVDVNALSRVNQQTSTGGLSGTGGAQSSAVGISGNAGATRVAGGSQTLNSGTVIQGSGNAVSSLANVAPQVGLDIDLLNAVTQTGGGGGGAGLLGGHLPPTPQPTLPPTLPPLPPTLRPTPPLTLPPTVPPTPPTLLLTSPLYPPTYPTALNVPYAYPPQPPSPSYLAPPLPPQFPKANCFEITDYDLNGNKGQSRIVCVPPPSPPTRRCFLRRCNKWSNQADTSCCFENHPHSQPHAPIPAPAPAPIYESPQPGQIESPINLRYDHFYP